MATILDRRVRVRPRVKERVRDQDQTHKPDPNQNQEHAYIPFTQTAILAALDHHKLRCVRSITVGNQIGQSELRG